ncbi:hypothetical protein RM533_11510 [Croceicoccus sp. F390]|uniref:Uncharacterized protein n=1 Tax=Croceicoccus esteveae TaxID=3075597 RepID=A0ABU2ZJL3_9SPHN|nr:hypothetical protein [Croceicoccus sp. F390]MDT0576800.1 hypothetical protein [Croceicoccus sp. F390]
MALPLRDRQTYQGWAGQVWQLGQFPAMMVRTPTLTLVLLRDLFQQNQSGAKLASNSDDAMLIPGAATAKVFNQKNSSR